MMEASAIGAAMSELAALPATSALAQPAASEGAEAAVAPLAQDALVPGAAPSTLLGPDALLTLSQTDTGGDDASEQPSARPAVEHATPSQNTHEAPTPTLTQANIAPTAMPLAPSYELQSRLVPRRTKQQRASDEDAEDKKRFSSLATAYDSSEELDPRE